MCIVQVGIVSTVNIGDNVNILSILGGCATSISDDIIYNVNWGKFDEM